MERLGELTKEQIAARHRPGREFARYVWVLAKNANGTLLAAAHEGEQRFGKTDAYLPTVLRAAVAAGTTVDAGWASELAPYRGLTREYVDEVARLSLFGKIPFVRVPFLTKTIVETSPYSAAWVAAGGPIPMSRATLSTPAMLPSKHVGALVPFTNEAFQVWSTAVETNGLPSITRAAV